MVKAKKAPRGEVGDGIEARAKMNTAALHALRQLGYLGRPSLRAFFRNSAARNAVTQLQMPAMSPTMTEGGIAQWKKKEGESFSAGDALLEIETDKATIDVEAQDDGIMGKILIPEGSKNVLVGKVIALIAEEGDDISNLQPPKEDVPPPATEKTAPPPPTVDPPKVDLGTPPPTPSQKHPKHSRPLFPSVHRLFVLNDVPNPDKIKGTGVRGMLTKGDVLAFLGKASSPTGTFKEPEKESTVPKVEQPKPALDGPTVRRLIVTGLLQTSLTARQVPSSPAKSLDFDSIIADYLPRNEVTSKERTVPPPPKQTPTTNYFDGLI